VRLVVIVDVHCIWLPVPMAEPLHWLMVTGSVELTVPPALQNDPGTRPPP
jgi:hypothetical protein